MYYQILVKYYKIIFNNNNDNAYKIAIESFLNENGVKSNNHYLQTRLPYLFITFCRNTKNELDKNAEIIFTTLSVYIILLL